jgi:hypothetical protein
VFDVDELVKVLEGENGIDVRVIDVPAEIRFVDHMVIVSGKSLRHMRAMAATIEYLVSQQHCFSFTLLKKHSHADFACNVKMYKRFYNIERHSCYGLDGGVQVFRHSNIKFSSLKNVLFMYVNTHINIDVFHVYLRCSTRRKSLNRTDHSNWKGKNAQTGLLWTLVGYVLVRYFC